MEKKVRKTFDNVRDTEKQFVTALWNDVQSSAKALGIEEFSWDITESDLDKNTISYSANCEECDSIYHGIPWYKRTWQQKYDAVGPHTYAGCVEISIRIRYGDKFFDEFSALCFGSYYRRIAEYYPDFTTRYIDSPKEVI